MNTPKISVIMSVFNGGRYLREAINSILNQSFADFEFIIIDDASEDDTAGILDEYRRKDDRVIVVHQEKNMGLTKALNRGIRLARGAFIARQDADDVSFSHRFANQLSIFSSNRNVGLVTGWYYIIDEDSNSVLLRRIPHGDIVIKRLNHENMICHSSVLIRKEVLDWVGGYNENLRYGQDKDLWKRLQCRVHVLQEPIVKYRISTSNISHKRFVGDDGAKNSLLLKERQMRWLSSLLLQEREMIAARKVLSDGLRMRHLSARHLFYYGLSYCPSWAVDFYMWNLRAYLRRI